MKIIIPGFQFAGIHSGIKDDVRKKDLALIYSEEKSTAIDGVFTRNKVCAPPVTVCRKIIGRGRGRLIVINSGIANACTGKRGMKDAQKTQREAARLFGLKKDEVFVCSTGKIGEFLPMKKLIPGLKKAKGDLGPGYFMDAVRGIMTTDQFPKFDSVRGNLG
ncbi:MAG: bifunctional ornithine acetyltransferase/N-acetylglutamate synthase, partial [Deltaproteobacteria bacterium]|nr:bifunctional ornithine acetyltransferase/N-acetylglutamate synthase [Deltaproteobacteria bacterium]